jgi:hypothetical protein
MEIKTAIREPSSDFIIKLHRSLKVRSGGCIDWIKQVELEGFWQFFHTISYIRFVVLTVLSD